MLKGRKKSWAFRRYILLDFHIGQMRSSLGVSRSLQKQEKRECMLRNGKILLEKLTATCNGKHNPMQNFTTEVLETATNNYDPEKVITNYLLHKLYNGLLQDHPISVMKFEDNLEAGHCFNCIEFASQMNHNNVLRFRGCCLETQIPILVFEFVAYGTLDNRIHGPCQSDFEPLLFKHRLKIAMEVANAVAYFHVGFSRPIVFREIKPSIILFQEHMLPSSSTFLIPEGETHIKDKVIGTFGFVAPEYLTTGVCNEKSDVYSFGALLLEILTGKRIDHSFCFESGKKHFLQALVKKHIENNTFVEIVDPVIVGEEGLWPDKDQQLLIYTEIAFKCLSKWEEDRPTIVEVAKQLRQVYQSI